MSMTHARWRGATLQFVRFIVTGVLNTAVGLAAIWLCWHALGLPTVPSNLIGYGVGLCVSFLINRRWTFRSDRAVRSAVPRFLVVFAVAYLCNLATLLAMIELLHLRVEWATLIANVPYTLVFFLGSRWFVFGPEHRSGRSGPWRPSRNVLP